jgi:hypothetical protein
VAKEADLFLAPLEGRTLKGEERNEKERVRERGKFSWS